jgi:hypothetical protein
LWLWIFRLLESAPSSALGWHWVSWVVESPWTSSETYSWGYQDLHRWPSRLRSHFGCTWTSFLFTLILLLSRKQLLCT